MSCPVYGLNHELAPHFSSPSLATGPARGAFMVHQKTSPQKRLLGQNKFLFEFVTFKRTSSCGETFLYEFKFCLFFNFLQKVKLQRQGSRE